MRLSTPFSSAKPTCSAIAFKHAKSIWYNLAAKRGDPCDDIVVYIKAWYLMICHEHAHNFEAGHGNGFINAFTHMVLDNSRKWNAFIDSHDMTEFNEWAQEVKRAAIVCGK